MNDQFASTTNSTAARLLKLVIGTNLPDSTDQKLEYCLFERYNHKPDKYMLRAYYRTRPFIPRSIQLFLRRRYARIQSAHIRFPAWPIEPRVVEILEDCLKQILQKRNRPLIHRISPWPEKKRFAFVITHDVEGKDGLRHAPNVAALEKKYGFVASWNIVPELYPIDGRIVENLKAEGCEIGVHGLKHDGREFESREVFEKRIIKIKQYASQWKAAGFRSPSTLRNVDWVPDLGFDYDSSFHDTDPYEPQPGGCCSIWPFFIKDVVELPITLPQDHTLFEILGYRDISIWRQKTDWIENHRGMVLIDVHPDYLLSPKQFSLYEQFLVYMRTKQDFWHALPREVARWWRERDASSLNEADGLWRIEGPASGRASILRITLEDDQLRDEFV